VHTMMRTVVVALIGTGMALVATASAEAARGGNRTTVDAMGTFVVHDLCGFPVTIDAHVVGHQTVAATGQGTIVRTHLHETDVYSANGNTVEGAYTFQIQVSIDDQGNVVKGFQTGVIVRVPLPNGETFQVTGRADTLNALTDYISAPTHGVTRNLDDLCAYLAS
jgi:hypothetical protein